MLRLIIAAVLASACLAYPQRRDGSPADAANLQPFDAGMQNMQGMQPMPAMPNMGMQGMQPMPGMAPGQFVPFGGNFGMGFKRDLDEDLEKRRHHSQFNEDSNKSPFGSDAGLGKFMDFMKENGNNLPFGSMDNSATDLGNFEPSAQKDDGKFRFFDKEQ